MLALPRRKKTCKPLLASAALPEMAQLEDWEETPELNLEMGKGAKSKASSPWWLS